MCVLPGRVVARRRRARVVVRAVARERVWTRVITGRCWRGRIQLLVISVERHSFVPRLVVF